MYTRFAKEPNRLARKYINELVPGADPKNNKRLYAERIRLLEILTVCLEVSDYLLALSLNATEKIDKHAHFHVNDSLLSYGRDAMQEMLVIRLRDLLQAEMGKPEKFRFHGFHESLLDFGIEYPRPNLETNNAIARIIRRRRYYSAHHGDGKKEHSYFKNRVHSLDLITAVAYIGKVEESLHEGKAFDPFERLLNDELDADRPLTLMSVYEAATGLEYEYLDEKNDDYELTAEYSAYESKAKQELQRIRNKVAKIIA